MVKKLKPHFSYHLPGSIWRILANEQWLVAETREGDIRQVNFAAIDMASGSLLWDRLLLPEPWWVGGTAIQADTLILQIFSDPQKPETRGIIGVDIPTGNVRWQNPELSLVHLTVQGIVAVLANETAPVYQLISLQTGLLISTSETLPLEPLPYIEKPFLLYPVHYTQENKYFSPIVSFIKQKLGTEPQKAVDYAEFRDLIIISYYIYNHKNLSNFLLVLNKEGDVLLHELIASHLPGVGLDTFLIVHQYLIVVKDKKELIVYEL